MAAIPYAPILKRVGFVLIAIGLADIGLMIYCLINHFSYGSSFNIFALIAGFFLVRGNLRATSIIYRFSIFMLVAFIITFGTLLIQVPLGLLLTYARLSPWHALMKISFGLGALCLLAWIIHELGRDPVKSAIAAKYPPSWRSSGRIAAIAGMALGIMLFSVGHGLQHSSGAQRALSLAAQNVGPSYNLFVTQLSEKTEQSQSSGSAVVLAWNATQIRQISVRWPN